MVDEAPETENRIANRSVAIRARNWFWRAAMRPEAGGHENFFIAKIRDSESVQRTFGRHSSASRASAMCRSNNARIVETIAAQGFL
jgi:hypothetical protein